MKKSAAPMWSAVWIGVWVCAIGGQSALADHPKHAPRMTVHVYNWAELEHDALSHTKEAAMGVFCQAGVDAVLQDLVVLSEEEAATAEGVNPQDFFVHIFSREMAKRLRLPVAALGLAPGAPDERGRNTIYVFDHAAEKMSEEHQEQVLSRVHGARMRPASKGQILGHAIAHEIGHVLLRRDSHAAGGLMRSRWNRNDLREMSAGSLRFTPEEAERLRAGVVRRAGSRLEQEQLRFAD
jgi:hypothetical protein